MAFSLLKLTGFTKASNLTLFLLLPCTFALFNITNLQSLAEGHWVKWQNPRAPGEKIWFQEGTIRWIGMQIHMWSVVPAGILLPLQFLPIMRRKFLYAHKLVGRLLLTLLLFANITAFMIGNHSFGGTLDTQCFVVILAGSVTLSVYKAWTSIRELRIDKHRRWVMRTWAYAGSILSLRVTMVFLILGIKNFCPNRFRTVLSCEELAFMYRSDAEGLVALAARHPMCVDLANGFGSSDAFVAVPASWGDNQESRTAIANLVFGASGVIGYFINAVLMEVYLDKTKEEDERLRKFSTMRRQAAGLEKKSQ